MHCYDNIAVQLCLIFHLPVKRMTCLVAVHPAKINVHIFLQKKTENMQITENKQTLM